MTKKLQYNQDELEKYGVNGVLILSRIRFWLRHNKKFSKNIKNGRVWTYLTQEELADSLKMSRRQLRYALDKLTADGILVIGTFNKYGYDKTRWYSVDSPDFIVGDLAVECAEPMDKIGQPIGQKWPMDVTKVANGLDKSGQTIPVEYNKPVEEKAVVPLIGGKSPTSTNEDGEFRAARGHASRAGQAQVVLASAIDEEAPAPNQEDEGKAQVPAPQPNEAEGPGGADSPPPKKPKRVRKETWGNTPEGVKITEVMINDAITLTLGIFPVDARASYPNLTTRSVVGRVLHTMTMQELRGIITAYEGLMHISQYAPNFFNVYDFFKRIDQVKRFVEESQLKNSDTYLQDHTKPTDYETAMFLVGGLMEWQYTPFLDAVVDDLLRVEPNNKLLTKYPKATLRKFVYLEAVKETMFREAHDEDGMRACYKYSVYHGLGDTLQMGVWKSNKKVKNAAAVWDIPRKDLLPEGAPDGYVLPGDHPQA